MPESTIAEKLIKLRYMHNLEREEFAEQLNFHWDTVEGWELHNIMPKPQNIKKLCEFYNVSLEFFHIYYKIYFDNPEEKIKAWKEKNNYTYEDLMDMLGVSHSAVARLMNGKIKIGL
ncbi:helix-turn-helix domain-containing protein [Clostridium oryzae]|uniref:Helix-turn-helix protein n=1 Tax=Clostridium oryzae TaxID=1450648 RepID=A0A1V4ITQ0_9CLOT|nr:helix-turn-helix transcriptional regulator [Clostridium oryzae]OPJ63392.1 helix-turn-helix protein [Clostridium oryzae]